MTDARAKYRSIPSLDSDRACDADAGDEDDPFSTNEWNSIETRARWTYFLLGCAILLSWNALINATPFFLSRLANSSFYATFSSSLSSVYNLTNLLCQFYCTLSLKQSSPSRRIFVSIIAAILLITFLCFSTFARGTPWSFFAFALFNGAFLAVVTSYICTSVLAGAALLGAPFLQTVLSGEAAIAVAVSAVQVASTVISLRGSFSGSVAMEVQDKGYQVESMAARIFFGVSVIFLGVTLVAYAWLTRQPIYKSITRTLERHREGGEVDECTSLVSSDCGGRPKETNSRVYYVMKRNWIFMFCVAYVFAVTLSVFPAITVRVQSVNPGIHPLLFTSLHFLVFNLGDLAGRWTCSFPRAVIWSERKIFGMAILRTLFIPVFLFCNVDRPATSVISTLINSDILFMIIMVAMGYTNGYVSTLAMLAVSSLEHNPRLEGRREDVDVAATLSGAFLNVGLASGALSSFVVQTMM